MKKENFETKLQQLIEVSTNIAMNNHQVVGEKHDYYITLEQLNDLLMAMKSEDLSEFRIKKDE